MFSLRNYFSKLLLTNENLGNAEKYEKGKYIHNLTEINFQWETSPQAVGSLIPSQATNDKGQEHQTFLLSLHLLINLIPTPTLFQITDGCMTMAKSPKPDLSYHLTIVRKMSCDLNVTHAQSLVLHTPHLCESAL